MIDLSGLLDAPFYVLHGKFSIYPDGDGQNHSIAILWPHTSADTFTLSGMSIAPARHRLYRAPASRRWIALLVASVLLHFILLGWISGNISIPSPHEQGASTITAQLHSAQQSEPAVAARPAVTRPKPVARVKPRRQAPTATPEIVASSPNEAAMPMPHMETPALDLTHASEAFLLLEGETPASADNGSLPDKPDLHHYKISVPPSAELKYDVQALRDGQMVYGSGKISWQSDGGNYTVNGEASILFFTLLNFKSAGVIDDFGVAPVIYSEKRFRRPETNTHFHRERNTISFSASTATYPRKGGEQDRASIVWQLTGIGRGDGEKFVPGAEIDFFVAGVRDAAPWRVRVIGEEQIEIGNGKVIAWHVVRIPKPGSYDQKLDIWLAPQHEWYPVKLRFTEANGEYLDMLLSNLPLAVAN